MTEYNIQDKILCVQKNIKNKSKVEVTGPAS